MLKLLAALLVIAVVGCNQAPPSSFGRPESDAAKPAGELDASAEIDAGSGAVAVGASDAATDAGDAETHRLDGAVCEDDDHDGVCNDIDPCPISRHNDSDGDGSCDSADICPGFDDKVDSDADRTPDGCDTCPGFMDDDFDGNTYPDHCDKVLATASIDTGAGVPWTGKGDVRFVWCFKGANVTEYTCVDTMRVAMDTPISGAQTINHLADDADLAALLDLAASPTPYGSRIVVIGTTKAGDEVQYGAAGKALFEAADTHTVTRAVQTVESLSVSGGMLHFKGSWELRGY